MRVLQLQFKVHIYYLACFYKLLLLVVDQFVYCTPQFLKLYS